MEISWWRVRGHNAIPTTFLRARWEEAGQTLGYRPRLYTLWHRDQPILGLFTGTILYIWAP